MFLSKVILRRPEHEDREVVALCNTESVEHKGRLYVRRTGGKDQVYYLATAWLRELDDETFDKERAVARRYIAGVNRSRKAKSDSDTPVFPPPGSDLNPIASSRRKLWLLALLHGEIPIRKTT